MMFNVWLAIGTFLEFIGIIFGIFYRPLVALAGIGIIINFIVFRKIPKNHNFY